MENSEKNYSKKRDSYVKWVVKTASEFENVLVVPFHRLDAGVADGFAVVADWNGSDISESGMSLSSFHEILEEWERRYYVFTKYGDEVYSCDHCGKYVDAIPSFYGNRMSFLTISTDRSTEIVCKDCFVLEDYLDHFVNNPETALPIDQLDNALKLGFEIFTTGYQNGLHEGMNDDPKKILDFFQKEYPHINFMFYISDISQFYTTFGILSKPKETDEG